MKTYRTKIADSEMYVVEINGMPLMFNTQEKADSYIKGITKFFGNFTYQPERSKREDLIRKSNPILDDPCQPWCAITGNDGSD